MEPAELLSLVFAALAAFAVGWLWYSPLLFGPVWMKEVLGHSTVPKTMTKEQKKQMTKGIVVGGLLQILSTYVLAHFLFVTSDGDLQHMYREAMETVLWIWAGFCLPLNFSSFLWEGRSLKIALINASQTLVSLITAAVILTAIL
ncbi:DUF1761 domain-containing protein [Candidatus Peregrinibacteria bacterium]|nr:MAG: DUF1761 domain-containing protein [Candidatus Peregrinibacteria bacterium]